MHQNAGKYLFLGMSRGWSKRYLLRGFWKNFLYDFENALREAMRPSNAVPKLSKNLIFFTLVEDHIACFHDWVSQLYTIILAVEEDLCQRSLKTSH